MDMGALRAHIHIYPGLLDDQSIVMVIEAIIRICLYNIPDQNVSETDTFQTVLDKTSVQPDTIMSGQTGWNVDRN